MPRSPREARLIGLNNRDLRTLTVDPSAPNGFAALVPDDRMVVAESGVREPSTLRRWRASVSTRRWWARSYAHGR